MFNEPRNWKWMLPASLAIILFFPSYVAFTKPGTELTFYLSRIGLIICGILLLSSSVNLALYIGRHTAEILFIRRKAMSLTADALILQAIKGVHPETLRLVFGERQRSWMLKAGIDLPEQIRSYSVLYARPDITEMFFLYFLENSKPHRVMPKRMLSDKSYRFDPIDKVTDYQQYDELVSYLQTRGVITQEYNANQTPLFISPWNPQLVAEDFGYEL